MHVVKTWTAIATARSENLLSRMNPTAGSSAMLSCSRAVCKELCYEAEMAIVLIAIHDAKDSSHIISRHAV
jgi:hypothetical protein